jgi:hypothetical protein
MAAKHKRAITAAIDTAEALASMDASDKRAIRAANAALRAANAAVDAAADASAAANASAAASNAAAAARLAAQDDAQEAAHAAANAADAAHGAFDLAPAASGGSNAVDADAAVEAMWSDYNLLLQRAEAQSWTDETPVPANLFGSLWPKGASEWAPNFRHAMDDFAIDLWIDPGTASVETLQKVFVALSDLHVAAGGTGLEFVADGDFIYTRELALA